MLELDQGNFTIRVSPRSKKRGYRKSLGKKDNKVVETAPEETEGAKEIQIRDLFLSKLEQTCILYIYIGHDI